MVQDAKKKLTNGIVLVLTAGTSDIPVAEEAAVTAEMLGSTVQTVYDVGVAGIHRILSKREILDAARVIVVVAGMDGALPSVVGGLVDKPVIAVPTSVGYGAGFQGLAPLLTMLNSCASGIAVMNIDNGFGAGVLAHRINLWEKSIRPFFSQRRRVSQRGHNQNLQPLRSKMQALVISFMVLAYLATLRPCEMPLFIFARTEHYSFMTLAYFDCFSGISGDMTLGALVDAGVAIDVLRAELAKLNLPGYEITAEKVKRSGIAATKVHVCLDEKDQHCAPSRGHRKDHRSLYTVFVDQAEKHLHLRTAGRGRSQGAWHNA